MTTSITFDLTGTLQDGSMVQRGCQSAPLTDVVAAADRVEIEGTTVTVTGLKGTVERGMVNVLGKRIARSDIEAYARNVRESAPTKVWAEGTVVRRVSDGALRCLLNGEWVRNDGTRPLTLNLGSEFATHQALADQRVSEGTWEVVFEPGGDPIKVGDRVRLDDHSGLFSLREGDVYTVAQVIENHNGTAGDTRLILVGGSGEYRVTRFSKV